MTSASSDRSARALHCIESLNFLKRLVEIDMRALLFMLPCLLSMAGCVAERESSSPRGGSILGDMAPFLTSGRPERGTAHSVGSDSRRAYVDIGQEPGQGDTQRAPVEESGGKISLNFVNSDLQEFVRVVFDEVLKENVIIDPNLQGRITVRTSEPVTKSAAVGLIRNVLQMNSANLTKTGRVYRVAALGGGPAGGGGNGAENIRIVPLKFLNAEQAKAVLQPFATSGIEVAANAGGRYLVLSGAPGDIDNLVQVLDTLDIDQMQGMSFALLPLKEASATSVSTELGQMFGQESEHEFRALPLTRMNSVLLISRTPQLIGRAREWTGRLDQASGDNRRVNVYPVQNRRATEIAQVLNGMLGKSDAIEQSKTSGSATAPAFTPAASQSPPSGSASLASKGAGMSPANAAGGGLFDAAPMMPSSGFSSVESLDRQSVQIRADASTNSLVIMAKPEEYRLIEATIRRLDVLPTQVLIEATIVEVTLNDALRHGVRWFFQQGNHGLTLSDGSSSTPDVLKGFNYVFKLPMGKVVVNALESVTDVEIISSPALTVLDNQTATLKVGDQVPIATRSARSVTNPEAPIVNDIELRDTGIILSVTPRVNASGLVLLDISQEASDVVPTSTSAIDSPTIRQRKINSSVAAQSGQEIVLGGLIASKRENTKEGVPILKDIPLLGAAFTSKGVRDKGRTELLIIIRPVVLSNRVDVRNVTQEIKARMTGVSDALYR
jgi:general secretion pathway protein D